MRLRGRGIAQAVAITTLLLSSLPATTAPSEQPRRPQYPDITRGISKTRGVDAREKLSPELAILFDQFTSISTSEARLDRFDARQLGELFNLVGLDPGNPRTLVGVTIELKGTVDDGDLKRHQARVFFRSGDMILADVPIYELERLAGEHFVLSIRATKAARVPRLPQPVQAPNFKEAPGLRNPQSSWRGSNSVDSPVEFSSGRLTGKGVIIGIIDTGIDWTHEDFIRADGSSRILYLWDMTDDSFDRSDGKIGTAPPLNGEGGARGPGTLYTREQINNALQGRGTVSSTDNFGHGTAAAGTAAGNGRATANGIAAGTYSGVAPEADLIVVKAGDCGSFDSNYVLGTHWITQVARQRGQPVVINHSLGSHFSAHDGSEPAEQLMNQLAGAGKPGVAITVSAGNEGKYSLHGSGRFGPRRLGQADVDGSPLELAISPERTSRQTWLNGYFDTRDDWGLAIRGSGNFLVDQIGRPFHLFVFKIDDKLKVQLQDGVKEPDYFKELAKSILDNSRLARPGERFDRLWMPLPPGNYMIWGFGPTAKVTNGSFDLYAPFYTEASFTIGAAKRLMVGSPGNAANVITVASYDFRSAWVNQQGGQTIYNLPLNDISDYSSPGGRLSDSIFKPDIAAPARYTISPMSATAGPDSQTCRGSNMGASAGWSAVTSDGKHIAWSGTSAAAPYVAGVVALIFQKNPNLDAAEIKDILIRTAKRDDFVGPVPNAEWGYGKLNPAAVLSATPLPNGTTRSNKKKSHQNKRTALN